MHADRKMTKGSWIDHPSEERDLEYPCPSQQAKSWKKERKP
jgi:hypothetical protein